MWGATMRPQNQNTMLTEYQDKYRPPGSSKPMVVVTKPKNPYHALKGTNAECSTFARSFYLTKAKSQNRQNGCFQPPNICCVSPQLIDCCEPDPDEQAEVDYTTVYKHDYKPWQTRQREPYKLKDNLKVKQGLVPIGDRCKKKPQCVARNMNSQVRIDREPFERLTIYRMDYTPHNIQPAHVRMNKGLPKNHCPPNARLDPCRPDTSRPDPCRPDPCRPDPCKDPCRPDPCRPDPCKDPCRPDPCMPDPCKPDPCRPDPCKPDPCRADPCKPFRYLPRRASMQCPEPCPPADCEATKSPVHSTMLCMQLDDKSMDMFQAAVSLKDCFKEWEAQQPLCSQENGNNGCKPRTPENCRPCPSPKMNPPPNCVPRCAPKHQCYGESSYKCCECGTNQVSDDSCFVTECDAS